MVQYGYYIQEAGTVKNLHVAVYVTGGIAAYKAAFFVRELIKKGAHVKVALTRSAEGFITPLTFGTLSRNHVYTDQEKNDGIVPHIELSDWSDIAVVIPATANIIAKMTSGIADDFTTSALLASSCPKFVIPAMNEKMYFNPATQRNLAQLHKDSVFVLEPDSGFLAEGYEGKGRLPKISRIVSWIEKKVQNFSLKQDLYGKKILITAGRTVEPIDPVRYITNHSTGKMGFALAKNAVARGGKVILVAGPTDLKIETGATLIQVQTTAQMDEVVEHYFSEMDIVIMAAAVSDYRVEKPAAQKIKKHSEKMSLSLIKNPDILLKLGTKKQKQLLVGFAAETQHLLSNATKKMKEKNVDLLVANDVSRSDIGFGSDQNEVTFLQPDKKPRLIKKTSKEEIAEKIFDMLLSK